MKMFTRFFYTAVCLALSGCESSGLKEERSSVLPLSLRANNSSLHYIVFFKDKVGTPYQIDCPEAFLSERAVARRRKHEVVATEEDLPVVPKYVEGLREAEARVYYTTRWLNAALILFPMAKISQIENLPYVKNVAIVAPGVKASETPSTQRQKSQKFLVEETKREPLTTKTLQTQLLHNATQNEMIGVDDMHEEGVFGEGVLIAVLDTSFPGVDNSSLYQHIYEEERMLDTYSFVLHSENVFGYTNGFHGASVFSAIAAFKPGEYEGTSHKAQYALYETESTHLEYRIEEYNWLFAAERADSLGADIIQASLGYRSFDVDTMNYSPNQLNGQYAVCTRAAEMASARGILVVEGVGNDGPSPRSLLSPSDGVHVLAVGAVNSNRVPAFFSSRGPTGDGRTKPDLCAMGEGTIVALEFAGQIQYMASNGTSLSTPLISGLAAGLMQALPEKKSSEIAALLKQSAHQSDSPDNVLGYGIPDYSRAVAEAKDNP